MGKYLLVCGIIIGLLGSSPVAAQEDESTWSPPANISNTASRVSAWPMSTADQVGRVHLVWAEATQAGGEGVLDTILYTRLVDGEWSQPVDVLAVPAGDSLRPDASHVDPYGQLVLVWHSERELYVSWADAADAASARAWTSRPLDVEVNVNTADLAIGQAGAYHVVYIRDNSELVYLFSPDAGTSWTKEQVLTGVDLTNLALIGPAIAVDNADGIYVSWTRTSEAIDWGPVGVWFVRSIDDGKTWEDKEELAGGGGYGWSDLLVDADQNVHLFFLGSGSTGGRYHLWSDDRGRSWAGPLLVARPEEITGFPGPPNLLLDSAGTVHAVFAGYGREGEKIWHATWNGVSWRGPDTISRDLPHSEKVSATVALGNQVHAAWMEFQSRDIWVSQYDTGAPPQAGQPLPRPEIEPVAERPTAVAGATATRQTDPPTRSAPQPATDLPLTEADAAAGLDIPPAAAGIAAAVVILLVVVVVQSLRRRSS